MYQLNNGFWSWVRPMFGRPRLGVFSDWSPIPGAAVHLDFVAKRYYWNGAERKQSDFAAFTLSGGTSLSASGLVLAGVAADFDVRISWASLGISVPCALIASFTPASVAVTQYAASIDVDTSNNASVSLSAASKRTLVVTTNITQADLLTAGASVGVRTTIGANFETNNILQSIDGATGAAADTTATLFTPTTLRIGERPGDTGPANGTIHHVVLMSGAQTQTNLNNACGLVHAR